MKPTLNKILLTVALSASTAYADYNGGQIKDIDAAQAGDITISHNFDNDGETIIRGGSVELSAENGDGKTITLEGNINITAGLEEWASSSDLHRNDGVRVLSQNAEIILKTAAASDAIIINTYGSGSHGVQNSSPTSKLILDAFGSTRGIEINLHNEHNGGAIISGGGGGGRVELIGNTLINLAGKSQSGVFTDSGTVDIKGNVTVNANGGIGFDLRKGVNELTVTGTATLNNVKTGISISNGSTAVFESAVNMKANSDAMWLDGSSLTFKSTAHIESGTGLTVGGGNNSTITLNGGYFKGNDSYNRNIAALTGTQIIGNQAKYTILGNIVSDRPGSLVDITMTGSSLLDGYAKLLGTGSTLNLALHNDSLWCVAGNSTLTNLTLGQGSGLQLAFSGTSLTDIITATGTITLEAGSVIYLTGDLSALQGGTFDFFSGTVDNQGVKFIGFDGTDWVEYEYTQTPGTNTFAFSASAPTVIEEPGFIPEPATATLGLLGLASLLSRRRRA